MVRDRGGRGRPSRMARLVWLDELATVLGTAETAVSDTTFISADERSWPRDGVAATLKTPGRRPRSFT